MTEDRKRADIKLLSMWVPADKLGECTAAVTAIINATRGRWVRDEELHPLANMNGYRWRIAHLDGSVTTGVWHSAAPEVEHQGNIEWFFPGDDK